jgi:photosystem II stability/assembly factor-like uncharacterized protein
VRLTPQANKNMKKNIPLIAFATLILLLAATTALHAQYEFTNGPADGGMVYDFIEHNNAWFVAQESFILRSDNQGQTWRILTEGLPISNITPRSFAEFDGYLYVSTNSSHRMLRSSDGGSTWSTFNTNMPLFFGVPTFLAQQMIVNNNRLIALHFGSDRIRYLNAGGTQWEASDFTGTGGNGIRAIGADSIVASVGSAYKLSIDNGVTWTDFPSRPPLTSGGVGASDFLKIGNRLIATTTAGGTSTTYYTTDGLTGWTLSSPGFYSGNAGITKLIHIADDHILGLSSTGIMKSTDQGQSWTEITTEATRPNGITRFMKRLGNDRLVVGTSAGIYLYDDLGAGARTIIELPVGNIHIFNTRPFDGGLLALHNGLLSYYSHDTNRWQRKVDIREMGLTIFGDGREFLRIDMLGNRIVLFATTQVLISAEGTTAATLSKDSFEAFPVPAGVRPVSVQQFGSRWIMIGGTLQNNQFWIGVTVHHSDDGGQNWTASSNDFGSGFALGPLFIGHSAFVHNGKWYLPDGTGFMRSEDQGLSWTRINQGSRVQLFSFDNTLFMSSSDDFNHRIMRSRDDGTTWEDWNGGLPNTNAFSRRTHGLLMIENVLYTYNDASASITPLAGETGLYRLESANANWVPVANHPVMPFIPFQLMANNGYIMAVQTQAGYWRSPKVGTSSSVETRNPESVRQAELTGNFPNPFNPATTIRYTLADAARTQIQVYNMLGQRVWSSAETLTPAGLHQLNFDAAGLSSGVYVYRLMVDGQFADSRTMLLLK